DERAAGARGEQICGGLSALLFDVLKGQVRESGACLVVVVAIRVLERLPRGLTRFEREGADEGDTRVDASVDVRPIVERRDQRASRSRQERPATYDDSRSPSAHPTSVPASIGKAGAVHIDGL